ncbi:MAG: hypothetical protein AAGF27_06750 [Pseudomonadota bacterium]
MTGPIPNLDPGARLSIYGVSQSGKSFLADKLANAWGRSRAIVIINPMEADPPALPIGDGASSLRPGIYRVSPTTPHQCRRQMLETLILSQRAHPVTLICDEASEYLDKDMPEMRRVFNSGRHRGLGTVIVSQSQTDIAPTYRKNTVATVYFAMTAQAEVNLITSQDRDLAAKVRKLRQGQHLIYRSGMGG